VPTPDALFESWWVWYSGSSCEYHEGEPGGCEYITEYTCIAGGYFVCYKAICQGMDYDYGCWEVGGYCPCE
jgi:hypothetical protein